jgi:serine/threonine protein kinase
MEAPMNVAAGTPTSSLEPRVGDRLGRLEILGHLADGGMARLWLARDNSRGVSRRWFAIKTVLPSLDASEYEEMLVEEAELASRVRHPNVVRTFGMGRHHGRPYIVQ